jgi:hypothetical protein
MLQPLSQGRFPSAGSGLNDTSPPGTLQKLNDYWKQINEIP